MIPFQVSRYERSNLSSSEWDLKMIQFPDNFAFYKRLRGGIYFVDVLPMTASGKIARNVVKQMAIELFHEEGVPSNFY